MDLTSKQVRQNAERIADEDMRRRVLLGVESLDKLVEAGTLVEDWPNWIDPSELNIWSCHECVLGQLFDTWQVDGLEMSESGYVKGLHLLDAIGGPADESSFHPIRRGLGLAADIDAAALQEAWITALSEDEGSGEE